MSLSKVELAQQIYQVSHLRGQFLLRSGQVSNEYFDKYQFEGRPELLRSIAEHMQSLIPKGTEVLAALEMGGIPIATALSLITNLPIVFVRKKAKEYGTCKFAEGLDISGKRACLVEDVVTSGGQALMSASDLRQNGAIIESAICVIQRDEKGFQSLASNGIHLIPLFTKRDLEHLQSH